MSKVKDILVHIDEAKHRFAEHLMRREDGRWSSATVRWYPREKKRPHGRPPLRWADSLAYRNNIYDQDPLGLAQVRDHLGTHKIDVDPPKQPGNREKQSAIISHGKAPLDIQFPSKLPLRHSELVKDLGKKEKTLSWSIHVDEVSSKALRILQSGMESIPYQRYPKTGKGPEDLYENLIL
ncbi:hypothetical protein V3C99_018030 [Haemonchus contortus]|uniref:DUF5710 domain-containing protein n=1 Tax=Haemonchus contortus TaxID=6289 RepID=A0A7I4Z2V0_HAECO